MLRHNNGFFYRAVIAGTLALAFGILALGATTSSAHHSTAMFEWGSAVPLEDATVTRWEWTNPHTWIQLNVEQNGVVTEWSLEGVSISQLGRQGWKRDMLKIGDAVSVFTTLHGTEDARANTGNANPTALLMSACMLLRQKGLISITT